MAGVETLAADALRDAGIDGAPFLGQVSSGAQGMLQLVDVAQLIAPDVQRLLFPQEQTA
ncbi:hypothetical protein LP419_06990 [Massilia sp. H-1]|nr:hypothetical protein LP419_06990 [Massilia sp. H-1]